jgi:hypothetical protein
VVFVAEVVEDKGRDRTLVVGLEASEVNGGRGMSGRSTAEARPCSLGESGNAGTLSTDSDRSVLALERDRELRMKL